MVLRILSEVGDGAIAGAAAKIVAIPFECVLTPLSARRDVAARGAAAAARGIFRAEGFLGFWKGAGVDFWRGGLSRGLTIGLFDVYRRHLGLPSGCCDGLAGVLTGATVTLVTYPLEVLQTGRRGAALAETRGASASALFARMVARGLGGLYPALLPSLVGCAGFWGVQFSCRGPLLDITNSPFAAGFLGSTVALLACGWNNCVRLTMQRQALEGLPRTTWFATLQDEYRLGGLARLYVGLPLRATQTGVTMGLLFTVHDRLRLFRGPL